MRKPALILAFILALVAPAAANADFATHFSVISKTVEEHRTNDGGFAFKDNLLDPANPSNSVGRDQGRCSKLRRSFECHATIYLNGELGGEGTLRVGGTLHRHEDRRLQVTGGTGDFNGVAGKALIGRHDLLEFALVR